jgi:DNA polymerase-3 subunit gamma/tau
MGDVEVLRRAWPDVLQTLSKIKRSTWALVEPNAKVAAFDGQLLTLTFTTSGLAGAFGRADHSENLRQAIHKTVGIECQITASAGGGTQASSDPNPKAPATRVAPATSADVAWGLAPAPSPRDSAEQPAPAGRANLANPQSDVPRTDSGDSADQQTSVRSGKQHQSAGNQPARDGASHTGALATAAPREPEAVPAASANKVSGSDAGRPGPDHSTEQVPAPVGASPVQAPDSAPAGDYSYSDDDWGPARDEDAPPLEEEPPIDWAPSARSLPSAPSAGSGSAGSSRTGSSVLASAPAGSATGPGNLPGARGNGQPERDAKPVAETPHDPWTRAVEQAPGVWVVGEESNVGKTASAGVPENTPSRPPAPHYEPATAQVPPSIPITRAGSSPEPDWGLAPSASPSGTGGPGLEELAQSFSSPDHVRVPEYAMASASSASAAVPGHVAPASAAPAPRTSPYPAPASPAAGQAAPTKAAPATAAQSASAAAAEARQSLYQRLSNSPEAEAGRAKAPARAVATAATYVQDIPSADDETIEESGVFGRAAVERILGGKLIEERSADGSPIAPRY